MIRKNNHGGMKNRMRRNNRQNYHHQNSGGHGGHGGPRKNVIAAREKYMAMGRDALASGDRILAENYFQHADHYYRMMLESGWKPRSFNAEQGDGEAEADVLPQEQEAGQENAPQEQRTQQINPRIPAGLPPAIPYSEQEDEHYVPVREARE